METPASAGPENLTMQPAGRKARRIGSVPEYVLPWITTPVLLAVFVIVWEFYIRSTGISAFILPRPEAVWLAWLQLLTSPRAWSHTAMTIYVTLLGFGWALLAGVTLGVLVARVRWLELTLNPFIIAVQVIPKVALLPLFVVWFGFGSTPKVIVAAVLAFFPILTNTVLGIKSVDTGFRDVMTSLNATRWQFFRRLELPFSLPYVLTGMEIGIVLAIIGAVVGEYLGGNAGLGYMLISSMNAYQTDYLFAVIIHLTLLGFVFYFGIGAIKKILTPWHQSSYS